MERSRRARVTPNQSPRAGQAPTVPCCIQPRRHLHQHSKLEEESMLSKEDNVTLTQVGPGTPGGNLMRMYWQPVAAAKELDDSPFRTKEVRVLGEDLVLFRDRQGKLGLIERFCSHRRVNLAIGVVEDDGLRCQYHGWKFNAEGQCIEQPFEDTMHPEAAFRSKCNITGYPVREMAGLVFAYMGPTPVPEFPMWEPYAWNNVVRD